MCPIIPLQQDGRGGRTLPGLSEFIIPSKTSPAMFESLSSNIEKKPNRIVFYSKMVSVYDSIHITLKSFFVSFTKIPINLSTSSVK